MDDVMTQRLISPRHCALSYTRTGPDTTCLGCWISQQSVSTKTKYGRGKRRAFPKQKSQGTDEGGRGTGKAILITTLTRNKWKFENEQTNQSRETENQWIESENPYKCHSGKQKKTSCLWQCVRNELKRRTQTSKTDCVHSLWRQGCNVMDERTSLTPFMLY